PIHPIQAGWFDSVRSFVQPWLVALSQYWNVCESILDSLLSLSSLRKEKSAFPSSASPRRRREWRTRVTRSQLWLGRSQAACLSSKFGPLPTRPSLRVRPRKPRNRSSERSRFSRKLGSRR